MVKYYRSIEGKIKELEAAEPGCWISLVDPTETEISDIEDDMNIDRDYIRAALDEEEPSRIETDDGVTLIVVDYPFAEQQDDGHDNTLQYSTTPMSIIITDKNVITVSAKENTVLDELSKGVVKGIQPNLRTRFVFTILLRIAARYLQYLKQIDKLSNYVEGKMYLSMKNKGLIQLLGLEKSLVYFSTSLKSNEAVLEKLMRGRYLKLYEEDQDLLDDVLIEVKQAIEMTNIYSNILNGTMDTFASIISNNLNIIMKRMTTITIILTMPTIVFSFYGMNLGDAANGLPLANVWFPIALSAVLAVGVGIFMNFIQKFK
ncbi:MAG: magnesium transporter CorA family protein [Oscillospiraceae bacterium]|nr:magnesium transporter CorA family protein [Oscillospiraceae bacterium]